MISVLYFCAATKSRMNRLKNAIFCCPGRYSFRPQKPFRGLKLYLPGQQNIAFFKRFIRDFVAAQKYNTLIMELNAGMRLDSHPELNAGWRELVLDTNYSRRNYPPGSLHSRSEEHTSEL